MSILSFGRLATPLVLPLLWSTAAALPSSHHAVIPRVVAAAPFTRLGCVTDVPQRALTASSKADDGMTVEMCADFCSPYQYFGVEYGRECYCGNTRDVESAAAPDSDCSFACAGNANETCGAGMRLDLYTNNNYAAFDPSQAAPAGAPYLGCFVDAAPRVLPDGIISVDDMSAAKCATNCAGYSYFGTEYGRECYCGNTAPAQVADESECNMPCSGKSTEMCGAGMRLSVYGPVGTTTPPPPPPPVSTHVDPTVVGDFTYDGCYTDSIALRVLPGYTLTQDDMTLSSCATICAGYTYFGVEYSTQCFCGTDLDASSMKSPETECTMKCGGDDSLVCGDANRLSLYKKTAAVAPSSPQVAGSFKYQSCWTDDVGARSLAAKTEAGSDMTVEKCAAFCDGYAYFGVEYSSECYCGNELAGGQSAAESDCSELCAGNPSEWCGGPNRLNLYAVNPISATTSTSVTPSTTTDSPSTITPAAQLTTITNCPASSTLVGGDQASCFYRMPSACAAMSTISYWWGGDMNIQQCSFSLGTPLPTNVASCMPSNIYGPSITPYSIYSCLQTAGLLCTYASDCTTATYTVGQEPTATSTVAATAAATTAAVLNAGWETGDKSDWTFPTWNSPFTTEDISTARTHSGTYAYRAVFTNDNGHNAQMTQKLSVVPGGNYTLSVWVSHDNPGGSWCGVSMNANPYLTIDWNAMSLSLRDVPATVWYQLKVPFQADASIATITLGYYCNCNDKRWDVSGYNTIYFDDIAVTRTDVV